MKNLETTLATFERQLEMSQGSLVSHNYVIQVGAYTMYLNSDKFVDYKNSLDIPSQWTEEGVEEIKEALKTMGDNREVKVIFYKDFYKQQIKALKSVIEFNKQIAQA